MCNLICEDEIIFGILVPVAIFGILFSLCWFIGWFSWPSKEEMKQLEKEANSYYGFDEDKELE